MTDSKSGETASPHEEAVAVLATWDAGEIVWTVEMGGMGPGYEQALQNAVFEALRIMVEHRFDTARWTDADAWKADRDVIEAAGLERLSDEGLSGAQWGAALSLASAFYAQGHDAARKKVEGDRAIMVQKEPSRRLSRAAPDLLKALEALLLQDEQDAGCVPCSAHLDAQNDARAAIAKATGQ